MAHVGLGHDLGLENSANVYGAAENETRRLPLPEMLQVQVGAHLTLLYNISKSVCVCVSCEWHMGRHFQ